MLMKSKWVGLLLVVSVAINLTLVGFLIGQRSSPFPNIDPTRGYTLWARTLSEERFAELKPILREGHRKRQPRRMRGLHREFRQQLTAEPLDITQLSQTLSKMRGHHEQAQSGHHETFLNLISALTLAERQALAKELGRGGLRPRKLGMPGPSTREPNVHPQRLHPQRPDESP